METDVSEEIRDEKFLLKITFLLLLTQHNSGKKKEPT